MLSRREWLRETIACLAGTAGAGAVCRGGKMQPEAPAGRPFFTTRGVVLTPEDLTLRNWPERAQQAGLTTLALHPEPSSVMPFVHSEAGQAFLAECRRRRLQVEYELHAIRDLLPRALFAQDPTLFRMNEQGQRVPDSNLCVHSERALEIACENAVKFGQTLRPTTGRYYYWGDDGAPWCRCPRCKGLSDSEQALLLENRMLSALRRADPRATLAHLAYAGTLPAPAQVKPAPGVFLEWAPIGRRHDLPYAAQGEKSLPDRLETLDANLAVFGAKTAQALEYWLDVSRFSGWKKPAVRLPWNDSVFAADLDTYGRRGMRRITSFAVYIDAAYVAQHGEPPLNAYGTALRHWQPAKARRTP